MPDVDAIIEQIIAASRAKGGRAFESARTYSDEPILLRGSQLSSYLPERVREMRAVARRPEARSWSDARLFVEQARLMADYEDDLPFHGEFKSYFPTYESMSNRVLRGYFTWRARVRSGEVEHTSTSFAYVYLYELLNGVGAEEGEGAFRAIEAFWQEWRRTDPSMDRYVRPWLVDYVAYHGLDPELALPYVGAEHDRAVAVLARAERRATSRPTPRGRRAPTLFGANPAETSELFDALCELSTYRVRESRLFKDDPSALREVSCAVFEELARYYLKSRSQGLTESLFGSRRPMPHLMFASAVFCPRERHEDCVVELGDTCTYTCRNGIWSCDALHDGGSRSAKLGQVLRAIDRQLRVALGHPSPLAEHGDPKYLVKIIDREARDYLAWREAHAPRRIEIDLSRLDGIRTAAAQTRESLLVDEEREEAPAAPAPSVPAPTEGGGALGLSPEAEALLRGLLAGRSESAPGVDLLVDAINERLFDLLGDTAVEFGADGSPELVEDYVEEVRAALGA